MRRPLLSLVTGSSLFAVSLLSSSVAAPVSALLSAPQAVQESAAVTLSTATTSHAPIITAGGQHIDLSQLKHLTSDSSAPVVYFTSSITPEGLQQAFSALGRQPTGKVAVKISTGEAGNPHYLQPNLIKNLVQSLSGTIVECNTAYMGKRFSTAMHRQVIADHGFNAIAPVDLLDEDGEISLTVPLSATPSHLSITKVGSHLTAYDFMVVLSHFKGHPMGGFGGALKNLSIGTASAAGKNLIHTAGYSDKPLSFLSAKMGAYFSNRTPEHVAFIESMAEAAAAVSAHFNHGQNMVYISVLNNLSVDCDCMSKPQHPDMHDLGIMASTDPVALDQACIDLVYAAPQSQALQKRIESRQGQVVLQHAAEIGLGSREYQLRVLPTD